MHVELFFFTLHISVFILSENKQTKNTQYVIDILSLQNGFQNLFSFTGFHFKSKVIEDSHKGKIYIACQISGHWLCL